MMRLPEMLRCDDERDFQSALGELSSIPKDEAIGLLEQLVLEADGTFRSRAIEGMARISPERGEALALRFLHDPEWFVRVDAVNTLRKLGSRRAAPLIAHLLATDPDELVRSWAAFSLGPLGDASVIPVLTTAAEQDRGMDHEGRPIRETALKSIEKIRSRLADQEQKRCHE
jgi:HEAT repeat protein